MASCCYYRCPDWCGAGQVWYFLLCQLGQVSMPATGGSVRCLQPNACARCCIPCKYWCSILHDGGSPWCRHGVLQSMMCPASHRPPQPQQYGAAVITQGSTPAVGTASGKVHACSTRSACAHMCKPLTGAPAALRVLTDTYTRI